MAEDAEIAENLLKALINHATVFEIQQIIANFQVFDNFSDGNPYKSLTFPSKHPEIVDFHYKRLIIVSEVVAGTLRKSADLSIISKSLRETLGNSTENAANLLIFLMICGEIAKNTPETLQILGCDPQFLEKVLNLESFQLARGDFKDFEAQIFKNINTFRLLLGNSREIHEFSGIFNEFFKLCAQDKRKKFEEIYNKVRKSLFPLNFFLLVDGLREKSRKQPKDGEIPRNRRKSGELRETDNFLNKYGDFLINFLINFAIS